MARKRRRLHNSNRTGSTLIDITFFCRFQVCSEIALLVATMLPVLVDPELVHHVQ